MFSYLNDCEITGFGIIGRKCLNVMLIRHQEIEDDGEEIIGAKDLQVQKTEICVILDLGMLTMF